MESRLSVGTPLTINDSGSPISLSDEQLERLGALERAEFFLAAADLADAQIVQTGAFQEHVQRFGDARADVARDAVLDQQFGPVSDRPAECGSLLRLVHSKEEMWRSVAQRFLASGNSLGFSPLEMPIVKHGLRIASVFDDIYVKWRAQLVESPIGLKMRAMGPAAASRWMAERGATNAYTVPVLRASGDIEELAYAAAFTDDYQTLDNLLADLLAELHPLRAESDETAAFCAYFLAYRRALAETRLDHLEEAWSDVDRLWMSIRGPLQPVHAMESYMEPARLRVDPEFRLVLADQRGQAINDRARISQQRVVGELAKLFDEYPSFRTSKPSLSESLVFAGTTIAMSGCNLQFRMAGQNVPNRVDVKLRYGTKILLDARTMEIRSKEMRGLMNRVFGEELTRTKLIDRNHLISAGVLIAGHEVCHSLFMTPSTEQRLGKTIYSLVEETKADFGGSVTLLRQVQQGLLSWAELEECLTSLVAAVLRDLKSREEDSHKPYYIKAVAYLTMMFESGLIFRDGSSWQIDYSPNKVEQFFAALTESFTRIADAYDQLDAMLVEDWLAHYQETAEIGELSRQVTG